MKFAISRSFPVRFLLRFYMCDDPSYSRSGRHHIPYLTYICHYLIVTRVLLVGNLLRILLPRTLMNSVGYSMVENRGVKGG
jgi:hypothetical protein